MSKTFEALKKSEKEARKNKGAVIGSKLMTFSNIKKASKAKVLSWIAEEYKRMGSHLRTDDNKNDIKTLLFTSSHSGEGTSTVLINFAIEMAKGGEKVLIVDANLRAPIIHENFNLEINNGLTELLYKKRNVGDVIKKTHLENLNVITSGAPISNPFTSFTSDSLRPLIDKIRPYADWILFDSPPIHAYNDSTALAEKMDGLIFVIQAEKTKWEVAQSAKEKITKENTKILGVILNKKQMHIPDWIYKRL